MPNTLINEKFLMDLFECFAPSSALGLVNQFILDISRLHNELTQFRELIMNGNVVDAGQLALAAHELKGLSLTLGSVALTTLCNETEALAESQAGSTKSTDWDIKLHALMTHCDQVRQELTRMSTTI